MDNKEQKSPSPHKMTSYFKWDIRSALLTVWFISTCISLLNDVRQDGNYTAFYLWLLALGVGYCIYMISLSFGELIAYKIMRASNIQSDYERAMIYESIVDSVKTNAYCEAYKVYDQKTDEFKGAIIILAEQDIDLEAISDHEQRQIIEQAQNLLQSLAERKKKK